MVTADKPEQFSVGPIAEKLLKKAGL